MIDRNREKRWDDAFSDSELLVQEQKQSHSAIDWEAEIDESELSLSIRESLSEYPESDITPLLEAK